jgi:hypothetical protein
MEGSSRFLAVFGLVAGLALLSGSASDSSTGKVVVTRNAVRLPEGCSPQQVAGLFAEFFTELETGDAGRLARFFAQEDPPGKAIEPAGRAFRWYSVTDGGGAGPEVGGKRQPLRHFVAYDVADLLPYFAERRRQNERMQLVAVEAATSNIAGAAGGTFVVRRDADDLPPGLGGNQRTAYGKFELDCAERRFFVWSMGMNLAPGQDLARGVSPCPLPPGWAPGTPAVACTRGPNARALATGFRLGRTAIALPAKCGPAAVTPRVVSSRHLQHGTRRGIRTAVRLTRPIPSVHRVDQRLRLHWRQGHEPFRERALQSRGRLDCNGSPSADGESRATS